MSSDDPIDRLWQAAREAELSDCPSESQIALAALNGPALLPSSVREHLLERFCERCEQALLRVWSLRFPAEELNVRARQWPPESTMGRAYAARVAAEPEPPRTSERTQARRTIDLRRVAQQALAALGASPMGELRMPLPTPAFAAAKLRHGDNQGRRAAATVAEGYCGPGIALRLDGPEALTLSVDFDALPELRGRDAVFLVLEEGRDEPVATARYPEAEGAHDTELSLAAPAGDRRALRVQPAVVGEAGERAAGAEVKYWEPYRPERGFGTLAAYVAPRTLDGFGLVPAGPRPSGDAADVDRRLTEQLFERLAQRGIRYREEPWTANIEQVVRHPAWMVSEGADCLDLSVAFAAMCLERGVAPLLAITADHAFVIVRAGWLATHPWPFDEFDIDGAAVYEPGVVRVDNPGPLLDALDDGALIAVDCASATRKDVTFAQAKAVAREHVGTDLHLVDVAYLQRSGQATVLLPPTGWPAIRLHLPGGAPDVVLFSTQAELVADLGRRGGVVALIAPPGQGKSTVARQVVAGAHGGAGWFLNAAEPKALEDSLAAAELAELGRDEDELATIERPDREGLALNALRRLRDASTPWVVVLDNADDDPSRLLPLMPQPTARGQLVIVTTTEDTWAGAPGVTPMLLAAAYPGEVERALGSRELSALVEGRALLVDAFGRLMRADGVGAPELLEAAGAAAAEGDLAGPAAFWAALAARPWFAEPHARLCAIAAHLPPDHLDPVLLVRLAEAGDDADAALAGRGLLELHEGEARMHRLFGEAIRRTPAPGAPTGQDVALALLADEGALALLASHGDRDTLERLHGHVLAADSEGAPGDRRLAAALHGLAVTLEAHGDTEGSVKAYSLLERHLDASREDDERLEAECLHAQARLANRRHGRDEARLREALEQERRALEIVGRLEGHAATGRFIALEGLLLKQLAAFPGPGETPVRVLDAALKLLEEADELRRDAPGVSRAERARSAFNLAGVRIPLAQQDRANAAEHLDAADDIYRRVAELRAQIYNTPVHTHIAICIQGRGLASFYRAALVPGTARQRSRWLRDATRWTTEALGQWETIEGPQDGTEVSKCARQLAKIAFARHLAARLGGDPEKLAAGIKALADEIASELAWVTDAAG